jgi:hypothetical protein
MENCNRCELNCPVILAADQTAADLNKQLEVLASREANRQTAESEWDTLIAETDPEQRMADVRIDGESLGNMFALRDAGTAFATISRGRDDDARRNITSQLWGLERDAATRKEACDKGPGKKYRLFGGPVCRSEIDG